MKDKSMLAGWLRRELIKYPEVGGQGWKLQATTLNQAAPPQYSARLLCHNQLVYG